MKLELLFFFALIAVAIFFVIRAHTHARHAKQFMNQVRRQSSPQFHCSDWTANEALILRTFLQSPTGTVLLQRARSMESVNAIKGANDVFHTQHSAGRTAGFSDAINWLESLASDQTIQSLSPAQAQNEQMPTQDQVNEALR